MHGITVLGADLKADGARACWARSSMEPVEVEGPEVADAVAASLAALPGQIR